MCKLLFLLDNFSYETEPLAQPQTNDLRASTQDNSVFLTWPASPSFFNDLVTYVVTVERNEDGTIQQHLFNTSVNSFLYDLDQRIACSMINISIHAFDSDSRTNQVSIAFDGADFTGIVHSSLCT